MEYYIQELHRFCFNNCVWHYIRSIGMVGSHGNIFIIFRFRLSRPYLLFCNNVIITYNKYRIYYDKIGNYMSMLLLMMMCW